MNWFLNLSLTLATKAYDGNPHFTGFATLNKDGFIFHTN